MTHILSGKEVAAKIKDEISKDVASLNEKGKVPKLTIVRLGEKSNDLSYEKGLTKNCEKLGIICEVLKLSESISTEGLKAEIERLNDDNSVHGVLIFRPLPGQIDSEAIALTLSPKKDVDCMTPLNLEKIFEGRFSGFSPGTPQACMEILRHYEIGLEGKNVVIINRTMVLGKPLSMMMLSENATVTLCHSKTKNLSEITKRADIVVTALGRARMIGEEYLNPDSICIDVGVSSDADGKICGDLDFDNLNGKVKMMTPVVGGVGAVTTGLLLRNVVKASKIGE